ncbi:MAG: hypothetical protein PVH00_03555 [Gemmatimonadota bacterium]|jgi:hypothetical protein
MIRKVLLGVLLLGSTACAVRLGGSKPEEYQTLALAVPDGASTGDVADLVKETGAQIVLLTANQDSAWFDELATATGLALSGPGRTEPDAKGFLTNLEILGDTSIVLGVADGTRMHMHDALYQIEEGRDIDLMFARINPDSDLRSAARTLLAYVASDVGPTAAIMLAIDAPTTQAADSVAVLLRAAWSTARECAGADAPSPERVRLYYGPSARVRCVRARPVNYEGMPIIADLVVGR